ncbi:MAG: ATP-binding cassette domain-containing protein, partial [Muribaculaceae bacterium]|nr:ATP-binding cassette domain-containing protein [Muribaculaceae bacterium]
RPKIRDFLCAFMFGGEASDTKVKVLSGGEKTRLAMIRLLLEPVNLLILDEPTNHLDMRTKDILKQAIKDFNGTVIVVSHDREFLDGLVEKVYEFGGGKVRECLGGIYEFLEKKRIDSLAELELTKSPTTKIADNKISETKPISSTIKSSEVNSGDPRSKTRLSYAEQREREKAIKRLQKKVADSEAEVTRLEQSVKQIEDEIAAGDCSEDIFKRHAQTQKDLENAMSIWELAVMDLEQSNS